MNDSQIKPPAPSALRASLPGREKDPKVRTFVFVMILLAVTLALHALEFRASAWSIDEYIFATGGQKIVSGGILYKDFGDNKPLLIYYTYALFYWLSGKNTLTFISFQNLRLSWSCS